MPDDPVSGPGVSAPRSRARIGAIILSGGRASRMGGIDKTALEVAGRSMLRRTTDAALDACDGTVIVVGTPPTDPATGRYLAEAGPSAGSMPYGAAPTGTGAPFILRSGQSAASRVVVMREEPAGGGPVAAITAVIGRVDADEVLLLAGDLAAGDRTVAALVAAGRGDSAGVDGIVLVDGAGRRQWLCARIRTQVLAEATARLTNPVGARMSDLFAGLHCRDLPDATGVTTDVDTWQDLSRARSRESGARMNDRTLPPEALDEWSSILRDRFGLDAEQVPIALVLDLARDVAHDVARPAAPLSAFVAGLVAGRAGGSPDDTAAALAEVVALAGAWAEGRAPRSDGSGV